jgi:hypothetical protein
MMMSSKNTLMGDWQVYLKIAKSRYSISYVEALEFLASCGNISNVIINSYHMEHHINRKWWLNID